MEASPFSKIFDALFLPAEQYRARYCVPRVQSGRALAGLNAPALPAGTDARPEALRIFISGGAFSTRCKLLSSLVDAQCEAGQTIIVLQPAEDSPHIRAGSSPQTVLAVSDGSYDPVQGLTNWDACSILEDAGSALGLNPAELDTPLSDALDYLQAQDGRLSLSSFIKNTTRQIGGNAFLDGNDTIAASHALPESRKLDYLRRELARDYALDWVMGKDSIRTAAKPGTVVVIRLPQGRSVWMGAALSELRTLCAHNRVFAVFSGVRIPEACRPMFESLPCARCLTYPDLPAMGWLWDEGTAAATACCLLRHHGSSAETVSQYFHQVEREKKTYSSNQSRAICDSGGFMGLFGANTFTTAATVTTARQWEARFPAERIASLADEEGLFMYGNHIYSGVIR